MPAINPNLNILSASANYTAGDWAQVGAQGSLDIQPAAAIRRGFDLGISAEALIKLDASVRKFIAIDVDAFATASAGVRAQLQTPIDLFSEAGVALRLQAQAQAAVGVQLGIGLSVGDFLNLVDSDPRWRGAPARLVRVLLEESSVTGGVLAKAAVAAMAYVNVSATGRLVPNGGARPGFTVAVEKGAGLGAGGGIKGFVNFGFQDPRNLVRRSVDVAVGSTIDDLITHLADPGVKLLLNELRTPLKIALRTTFEIGLELASNGGSFSAGAGSTLSLRAVQVVLEEAQRAVFERAVQWAADELKRAIASFPLTRNLWNSTAADRTALANLLQSLPAEPFEATAANRTYWSNVIDLASRVLAAIGGQTGPNDAGVEPLATLYAATQLLFIAVERVSNGSARASVIGVNPVATAAAFSGPVVAPSNVIRAHINQIIGKPLTRAIDQASLVTFLAEGRVLTQVAATFPELETIASIIAGERPGALGRGFSTILSNIGSFVPDSAGRVDPKASLEAILRGLREYTSVRVNDELIPALEELLDDAPPELQTYLDEVLLSSLNFSIESVFTSLINWANGSSAGQAALREACSAVLMRLFGRSLIVTADAVVSRLFEGMSGAYRDLASHINDPGGIAATLAAITGSSGHSRNDLAEILSEHFLVLADASRPLSNEQRARIRDLLYRMIDTAPADPNAAFVDQLMTDLGARNIEAGIELALEFGTILADRFISFVVAWLARVGTRMLEEFIEVVDAIVDAVRAWLDDLESLARDLARRFDELLADISRFALAAENQFDAALDAAANMVAALGATGTARTRLRNNLRSAAVDAAMGALATVPGYDLVPSPAISQVHAALRAAVDLLLSDELLNPVLDAIRGPALDAADFLRDLRDIEPGDDLVEAVLNLFADRIEDAITDTFGSANPKFSMRLQFTARWSVQTLFGTATLTFPVDLDFGTIRVPLGDVINAARDAAGSIDAVVNAAEDVAAKLAASIRAELDLEDAQTEHAVVTQSKADADAAIAESYPAALGAEIISPAPSSIVEGSVLVDIHLPGVPESYLGLQPDSMPRVHVWLNREEIALSLFEVRSIGSTRDIGAIGGFDPRAIPGPRSLDFGPVTNSRQVRAHGRETFSVASTRRSHTSLVRTTHPLMEERTSLKRGVTSPGKSPGSTFRNHKTLGRGLHFNDRERIEQTSYPGIAIRLRLTPGQVASGINTLMVSVVDGRGRHRIDREVTFVALPRSQRPKPPVVRPGRIKVPVPDAAIYALTELPNSVRDRLEKALGGKVPNLTRAAGGKFRPPGKFGPVFDAPKSTRVEQVKRERERVRTSLHAARAPIHELRDALKKQTLRAVVTRPAKSSAEVKPAPTPSKSGARPSVKVGTPVKTVRPSKVSKIASGRPKVQRQKKVP